MVIDPKTYRSLALTRGATQVLETMTPLTNAEFGRSMIKRYVHT